MPLSSMPLRRMPLHRMPLRRMPLCRMPLCRMPLTRMPLSRMPLGRMPLSRMPLSRMPLSRMLLIRMPLNRMTLSKMTISRMTLSRMTLDNETQLCKKHCTSVLLTVSRLNVTRLNVVAPTSAYWKHQHKRYIRSSRLAKSMNNKVKSNEPNSFHLAKLDSFRAIGFFFWQSNDWEKVQYNTDLLKPRHNYLYRKGWHCLIIKTLIKCKKSFEKAFGELNGSLFLICEFVFILRNGLTKVASQLF